tara:strand:- start:163 stop:450 length:288 start_codon:yes stop_codon:yes gene_type:complete
LKKTNFNKEEISKILSFKKGFPLSLSKKLINDLLNILIFDLKSKKVIIKNIGSFKTILKNERIGRNPKTGQNFKINSRKSIKFSPSKKLIKQIND